MKKNLTINQTLFFNPSRPEKKTDSRALAVELQNQRNAEYFEKLRTGEIVEHHASEAMRPLTYWLGKDEGVMTQDRTMDTGTKNLVLNQDY